MAYGLVVQFLDVVKQDSLLAEWGSSREFSWDEACGVNGSLLIETSENYNFDTMHKKITDYTSVDGHCAGQESNPLLFHWGNIKAANSCVDRGMSCLKRMGTNEAEIKSLGGLQAMCFSPYLLHLLGRGSEAAAIMRSLKIDFSNAEATVRFPTVASPVPSAITEAIIGTATDWCHAAAPAHRSAYWRRRWWSSVMRRINSGGRLTLSGISRSCTCWCTTTSQMSFRPTKSPPPCQTCDRRGAEPAASFAMRPYPHVELFGHIRVVRLRTRPGRDGL